MLAAAMTTPGRFQRVSDIADAALDHPPADRPRFLAAACAGDETLRAEVLSLLDAYEDARGRSFLETPAAALRGGPPGADEDERDEALSRGTRLGAYELGEVVGRGGMGVVYRAVRADDEYRQVVAVKVIRRGVDTALGQRRFREERQILAGLDHPGIARLLDGGTTDGGLPYFVMEYVEGEPIDAYCDRRRLEVAGRLRLFVRVCAAVHHAHRSLVVHRDIKPGNVLVTADGVPKLLDFGIARLVRPAGEPAGDNPTVTVLRMLTPDYASPEQVRGEPVTTATDVYSLGVLLYELLSGQPPYRAGHVHELLAAICDQDPERPSTAATRTRQAKTAEPPALLRKRLAGDLDTIVLKSLRKAPNDRYASVEAFADDVTRHLEGRPVEARPQTLAYRAGKFVRRNRAATAAAALAVAALLGGIVATTRQARIAESNRRRAEQRFDDVRTLADFVMFEMHDAIVPLPGSTRARKQLVERALQYLDRLAGEGITDPVLRGEIARGYARLGEVQGQSNAANLGDRAGALTSLRKAIAIQEQVAGGALAGAEARAALARFHTQAAHLAAGEDKGASLARAEQILRSIEGPERDSGAVLMAWQAYYQGRAGLEADAGGNLAVVRDLRQRQMEIAETLLARSPEDRDRQRDVALACKNYGAVLHALDEYGAARPLYDRAIELDQRIVAAEPANPHRKLDLAFSHASLGSLLRDEGDLAGALRPYAKAQELREAAYAADPDNDRAFTSVVRGHESQAGVLSRMGEVEAALRHLREARTLREELEKRRPSPHGDAGWEASFHEAAGDVLAQAATATPSRRRAYWRRARDEYTRSLALWEEIAAQRPLEGDDVATPPRLREAIGRCTQALGGGSP